MRWNKRGEGDGRSYQIRLGTEARLYRSTLDKGYNAIKRSQSSGTEQASPSPLSSRCSESVALVQNTNGYFLIITNLNPISGIRTFGVAPSLRKTRDSSSSNS